NLEKGIMILHKIQEKAVQYFPEVQGIRHYIHANLELSFQEYKTSAFVADKLERIGIKYQGIANTGIVALIEVNNPGKRCIALRSDMDALPIQEKNEVAYKSKNNGVMHA